MKHAGSIVYILISANKFPTILLHQFVLFVLLLSITFSKKCCNSFSQQSAYRPICDPCLLGFQCVSTKVVPTLPRQVSRNGVCRRRKNIVRRLECCVRRVKRFVDRIEVSARQICIQSVVVVYKIARQCKRAKKCARKKRPNFFHFTFFSKKMFSFLPSIFIGKICFSIEIEFFSELFVQNCSFRKKSVEFFVESLQSRKKHFFRKFCQSLQHRGRQKYFSTKVDRFLAISLR